jgi:hypothetical protein
VAGVGVLPEGVGQTLQERPLLVHDLQSSS